MGAILKAGECAGASSAFRYCDTDDIDPNYDEGKLLDQALENSEVEGAEGEDA